MLYKIEKNCTGCGICASVCESNLITVYDNHIEMDIEHYTHCSKCVNSCQNNVFTKTVVLKHFIKLFEIKIRNIF